MLPINVGRLMSDTSTNMNSEWTEQPKSKGALPGAQLAAQREAMGLTVDQIADQLKLAPRQVVALEADDYASLPNMAVTRGFVRAYAKVVKLDAAPLVAMIEVNPIAGHEHPQPARREISASFSGSRFPTMTERSTKPSAWLMGAAGAAVIAAAVGAYYVGLFPNLSPGQKGTAATPAASAPAATAAPAGAASAPMQSANVPLISVAPPADPNAPASAPVVLPAPQTATPAATPPAATVTVPGAGLPPAAGTAPAAQPPAQAGATAPGAAVKPGTPPVAAVPAPAAAAPAAPAPGASTLVLTATEDSWITIQPPGKKALVSRMLKAGSTETFEVPGPALLIVGKPANVKATLQGAPLDLPPVPGGTISRVNIK
jgi:cytoskeleton protein RodZ